MRAIAVGWAIIALVGSPFIAGYLIGGPDGFGAVVVAFIGLLMLGLLTLLAWSIGSGILGEPDAPRALPQPKRPDPSRPR